MPIVKWLSMFHTSIPSWAKAKLERPGMPSSETVSMPTYWAIPYNHLFLNIHKNYYIMPTYSKMLLCVEVFWKLKAHINILYSYQHYRMKKLVFCEHYSFLLLSKHLIVNYFNIQSIWWCRNHLFPMWHRPVV